MQAADRTCAAHLNVILLGSKPRAQKEVEDKK
jgi:hypothetical protein